MKCCSNTETKMPSRQEVNSKSGLKQTQVYVSVYNQQENTVGWWLTKRLGLRIGTVETMQKLHS